MYIPSNKTLDKILISLSSHCGQELCLPGNWSPSIFVEDLFKYPVTDKNILCTNFVTALVEKHSYRTFFEKSRGFPKQVESEIWDLFDKGQLMLVGEKIFLALINGSVTHSDQVLKCLQELSGKHISEWSKIISNYPKVVQQYLISNIED